MNKMHYRKTGDPKWKYELTENYVFYVGQFPMFYHDFFEVNDGILILREGYAIDGVTCWPDFEGLMPGAFVHDALLQAESERLVGPKSHQIAHKRFYWACYKDTLLRKISALVAYFGLELLYPVYRWFK